MVMDDDDNDGRTYKVQAFQLTCVYVCVSTVIDFFARGRPRITDDEPRCFKYNPWPTTRVVLAMATAIRSLEE